MTSSESKAVFLSYASQDAEAARRICEALRASGVEVWFDQNELVGGDAWDGKIRRQIKECALFVPLISSNTNARLEGYFRREWKLAVDRTHDMAEEKTFLMPVVIDATSDAAASVPGKFREVQWTRMAGGDASAAFCRRVQALLGGPTTPAVAVGERIAHADPVPAAPRTRKRLFAAALALLAAGSALWVWRPEKNRADADSQSSPRGSAKNITAVTPAEPAAKSVAVLPFANQSADKDNEYLSDGIADELLTVLQKIPELRVAARTSAFSFKGRNATVREVGEKLGMAHVVEGTVQKFGSRVKITARLSRAATNEELWSRSFGPLELTDIFAMESEIAQAIVGEVSGRLTGAGDGAGAAKAEIRAQVQAAFTGGTKNPDAHRLYLQGRFQFNLSTQAGWAEAERSFQAAVELDPRFAQAYCGLADVYGFKGGYTTLGRAAWAKEKELAEQALALAPNLADAHLSLGIALASVFDWQGGEAAMKRALELNPNLALAHDQYAWLLTMNGRMEEALRQSQQALELDPLSPVLSNDRAGYLVQMRRYDEAIAQGRKTNALQPNDAFAHGIIGWALVFRGEFAAAIAEFRRARTLDDLPWFAGSFGYALAVSGDRAGAEEILRELDDMAGRQWVASGVRVYVYLGLGDVGPALDWLEKACDEQDQICWGMKVDRVFDPIRDEPRFRVLLKKTGLDR